MTSLTSLSVTSSTVSSLSVTSFFLQIKLFYFKDKKIEKHEINLQTNIYIVNTLSHRSVGRTDGRLLGGGGRATAPEEGTLLGWWQSHRARGGQHTLPSDRTKNLRSDKKFRSDKKTSDR